MPTTTLHPTYQQLVRNAIAEELRRFPDERPNVADVTTTAFLLYGGDVTMLDGDIERLEAYASELISREDRA